MTLRSIRASSGGSIATIREGRCDLFNFIAIEPVVNGIRGFSELETLSGVKA